MAVAGAPPTLADELERNPAFQLTEEAFVHDLLGRLDEYPHHYSRMGELNRLGPAVPDLSIAAPASPAEVARRRDAGETLVDLRPRADFARAHVRGSINLEGTGAMADYVGWLVPRNHPLTLIGDGDALAAAVRSLARIGVDRPGSAGDDLSGLFAAAGRSSYPRRSFADLEVEVGFGRPVVVDARSDLEWRTGHVAGAWHVPVQRLNRFPESSDRVWAYCRSGFRAAVLASLLDAHDQAVVLVDDDLDAVHATELPWCTGTDCGDVRCSEGTA